MTKQTGSRHGITPTLESERDRGHLAGAVDAESGIAPTVSDAGIPAPRALADDAEAGPPTIASAPPRIEDDGIIGRGGMGAVHRVYDRNIRRYSAMKVIERDLATDASARGRFIAEAQITGQLEHPHVVPVYDLSLGDAGEPQHFTMKLVEGETLSAFIRPARVARRTDAELWELLSVFMKVCDTVSYAHSRGVVHRDLKPENIMMGAYGQVYVMDWGIARAVGAPFGDPPSHAPSRPADSGEAPRPAQPPVCTDADDVVEARGTIIGTPQYMAPEQARGRNDLVDARTDVFALGAILYHILTGRPPYRGAQPADVLDLARTAAVKPPGEVSPGVPLSPARSDIAMKAMQAAPEDRYPSAAALKRDVERAVRGGLWLGTKTFPAGTLILKEGDPSDAAYIITKGRCTAFRAVQGERRVLREMRAGDVFGEMALLSAKPRSASVVAVDDVSAIVVTPETLAREIPAESWLVPLLRTLVERFRELEESARR